MKALLNWRYYVIYGLFAIGLYSLLAISGNDDRPLGAWIEIRLYLALISATSFYTLRRLRIYWESKGKIPEFTNQCK